MNRYHIVRAVVRAVFWLSLAMAIALLTSITL